MSTKVIIENSLRHQLEIYMSIIPRIGEKIVMEFQTVIVKDVIYAIHPIENHLTHIRIICE